MRKTYFNSRPSARGDKAYIIKCWKITYFNSRPSARGDRKIKTIDDPNDLFQFTPLREGRRILFPPTVLFSNFNSRPSARGDQQIKRITIFQHYFNSRPSARGDTRNRRHFWQWQRFQFTPLREGRHLTLEEAYKAAIFQFTPLREGRHCTERSLKNSMYISIHAPPRGATRGARGFRVSGGGISIHAPPRGATLQAALRMRYSGKFQFTPLREGRPAQRV